MKICLLFTISLAIIVSFDGTDGNVKKEQQYQFGGDVHFHCPHNEAMSAIWSDYSAAHRDRVFYHGCDPVPLTNAAITSSSSPLNHLYGRVEFRCPNNYVLTGTSSFYHKGDRVYYYNCSQLDGTTYDCEWLVRTDWNKQWVISLDDYQVITRVTSAYDGKQKDRTFRFYACYYDVARK